MKDRGKTCSLLLLYRCALALIFFSGIIFSTLRLYCKVKYHPNLVSTWLMLHSQLISTVSQAAHGISVGETVLFPDQALLFLKYPPWTPLLTQHDINCMYLSPNTSPISSPLSINGEYHDHQIVSCELPPRGMIISVGLKGGDNLPPGPMYEWNSLAYEAMIDDDNTTVVFVKGLNLRSGKVCDASAFKCVYSSNVSNRTLLFTSDVVTIAQEIVRCRTPLSILVGLHNGKISSSSIKVSVKSIRGMVLGSIARPEFRAGLTINVNKHQVCVCTMVRNQARFLHEWVMYHGRIGVERWFIYDNNSDDDIEEIIELLVGKGFKITRHFWPWIKAQEAGFSHCALRARDYCEWVAFIDVDEFIHMPNGVHLGSMISNETSSPEVAELRISCHNFGPSGLTELPTQGVTVGYTCRMRDPERHKSIVRPEKLSSTLLNIVHHFDLKDGFEPLYVNRNVLVINHYKYQVWEVFKEKFYRRVSAYVSDWQQEVNLGSNDRTPGLGTQALEPADWSRWFCQINDTGLRDWVVKTFSDQHTGMLPWQQEERVL